MTSSARSFSPAAPEPGPGNNVLFEAAYEEFVTSLPASELALVKKCCSAKDLSRQVQSIPAFKGLTSSRRKKLLEHVNAFNEVLLPFAAVINLFVSSRPEWAAIIWGSVNLLFQVSAHHLSASSRRDIYCDYLAIE